MKRYIWAGLIASALIIASTDLPSTAVARSSRIERAVVSLNEPVRLLGVVLRGRYLFLHHQGMMERGRPCTYVYTLDPEKEGRLVLSFHCRPVTRERAVEFKLSTKSVPGDLAEVIEVQFAGTVEGHGVPDYEPAE
ncbi:MAG TPA: hypothetical protein VNS63_12950 [Blastocatellia bacterium]|nr:hypothetical protein [Blastocatellia bacterium]